MTECRIEKHQAEARAGGLWCATHERTETDCLRAKLADVQEKLDAQEIRAQDAAEERGEALAKLAAAEKRATDAEESAAGMRAYWLDVVTMVREIAPHHSNTHGATRQLIRDYQAMEKRLAEAEKCAEVLCTFALMLPSECGPNVDHCDSESCAQCRAIDACEPYMEARNKREAH